MRIYPLIVALALMLPSISSANTVDPVQQHNSNAVWFENWIGLSNAKMTISAPNGKLYEVIAATGTPVFELDRAEAQDGIYRYELSAATEEKVEIVNPINNGRQEIGTSQVKPFYLTGAFVVSRGVIITPEQVKEE